MAKTCCRRYNHRITIQRESTPRADDDQGGYALGWTDVCTTWAAFESPTGRESLFAGQLQASVTQIAYIPYRAGIDATMRVRFGTRVMNIRAVLDEGERKRELKLMVEEGVAT